MKMNLNLLKSQNYARYLNIKSLKEKETIFFATQ